MPAHFACKLAWHVYIEHTRGQTYILHICRRCMVWSRGAGSRGSSGWCSGACSTGCGSAFPGRTSRCTRSIRRTSPPHLQSSVSRMSVWYNASNNVHVTHVALCHFIQVCYSENCTIGTHVVCKRLTYVRSLIQETMCTPQTLYCCGTLFRTTYYTTVQTRHAVARQSAR
jgi:hypothetical protein